MFTRTILSFALIAALAACGGGGGGSDNTTTGTVTTPTPTPAPVTTAANPATSVPTPTYSSSSPAATIFNQLNAYRLAAGVGMLAQDNRLDGAATAHALYNGVNIENGTLAGLTHTESSSLSNYYADSIYARAMKGGFPATDPVSEEAGWYDLSATDCVFRLLGSVYHQYGLLDNGEVVGIGTYSIATGTYAGTNVCIIDQGQTTVTSTLPSGYTGGLSLSGGQLPAANTLIASPYSGATNAPRRLYSESPNPAPDLTNAGTPVMVMVPGDGNTLNVATFTLTDSSGNPVAGRILVSTNGAAGSTASVVADPNSVLPGGVAFFIPLAPLNATSSYTASFTGKNNGVSLTKTWTFVTSQ